MLDIQQIMNAVNEQGERDRRSYHLTYGGLIDSLRELPEDMEVDERIKGISCYRGYYSDIAINTVDEGANMSKETFDWHANGGAKGYMEWEKENKVILDSLPRKAKELADVLEAQIGLYMDGYKGGDYDINRDRVLWLAPDWSDNSDVAVVGLGDSGELITKTID